MLVEQLRSLLTHTQPPVNPGREERGDRDDQNDALTKSHRSESAGDEARGSRAPHTGLSPHPTQPAFGVRSAAALHDEVDEQDEPDHDHREHHADQKPLLRVGEGSNPTEHRVSSCRRDRLVFAPLQRADAHAEDLGGGGLIPLRVVEYALDVLCFEFIEGRPHAIQRHRAGELGL